MNAHTDQIKDAIRAHINSLKLDTQVLIDLLTPLINRGAVIDDSELVDLVASQQCTVDPVLAQAVTRFLLVCGGSYGLNTLLYILRIYSPSCLGLIKQVAQELGQHDLILKSMREYVASYAATPRNEMVLAVHGAAITRYVSA